MTLLARLQAATGPDRELDRAIADAVDPNIERFGVKLPTYRINKVTKEIDDLGYFRRDLCPSFTASIDAALSWMPEGWHWSVDGNYYGRGYNARLAEPVETKFGPGIAHRANAYNAPTPALALCIAIAKARGIA